MDFLDSDGLDDVNVTYDAVFLVIHGVGFEESKEEKYHTRLTSAINKGLEYFDRKPVNYLIRVIKWKECVSEYEAEVLRLFPSQSELRQSMNKFVGDVLYYLTPHIGDKLTTFVAAKLNWEVNMLRSKKSTANAKIAVMAHSLGSALAFEVLTGNKTRPSALGVPLVPFSSIDALFLLGSPLGGFLALQPNAQEWKLPPFPVLNIFSSDDPIAFRIEPLFAREPACVQMIKAKNAISPNLSPAFLSQDTKPAKLSRRAKKKAIKNSKAPLYPSALLLPPLPSSSHHGGLTSTKECWSPIGTWKQQILKTYSRIDGARARQSQVPEEKRSSASPLAAPIAHTTVSAPSVIEQQPVVAAADGESKTSSLKMKMARKFGDFKSKWRHQTSSTETTNHQTIAQKNVVVEEKEVSGEAERLGTECKDQTNDIFVSPDVESLSSSSDLSTDEEFDLIEFSVETSEDENEGISKPKEIKMFGNPEAHISFGNKPSHRKKSFQISDSGSLHECSSEVENKKKSSKWHFFSSITKIIRKSSKKSHRRSDAKKLLGEDQSTVDMHLLATLPDHPNTYLGRFVLLEEGDRTIHDGGVTFCGRLDFELSRSERSLRGFVPQLNALYAHVSYLSSPIVALAMLETLFPLDIK